jgi:hypothetical protein
VKYRRLVELAIRHAAYPAGRCSDLQITPSSSSSGTRALQRHRMLARSTPTGLVIAAQVSDDGPKVPFGNDLTLSFDLRVLDANFTRLTKLTSWSGIAAPTYRSTDPASGVLSLQAGPAGYAHPPGVAAVIEIVDVAPTWLTAPPTFTLEFEGRELLWAYYLLTSRSKTDAPRIEDAHPKSPMSFVHKKLTTTNTSASVDPVGARLLQRFPDRRCHRLLAKRPLAAEQVHRRELALYIGDEMLIQRLAPPSVHDFTIIQPKPSDPRESIYRVVEF